MTTKTAPAYCHATALVVGEHGVLIEGASGSGKSRLAAALLRDAEAAGRFGRLVGDDRIALREAGGRLVAGPHPAIAGLLEQRGVGLRRVPFEPACVLHLVVSLVDEGAVPARMPETPSCWHYAGVTLPCLVLLRNTSARDQAGLVADALAPRPDFASLEALQSSC